MSILIVAEHDQKTLQASTYHVVAAAQQYKKDFSVGGKVALFVAGDSCDDVVAQARKIENIDKVIYANDKKFAHILAEDVAAQIEKIADEFEAILFSSTTFGKNIMPRVAGLLDVAPLSDVMGFADGQHFIRPIYAGNAIAYVNWHEDKKLMTVRTTAFEKASVSDGEAALDVCEVVQLDATTTYVGAELSKSERPELTAAPVVISGGRGMQNGDNFTLLEKLADLLGGAIGASRAAVDAGFVPNDYQVGQTGKIVAPELYIAVGISGAIQHLAGMKDSKVIVAINKDEDAPIFQVADYGLVADLFEVVPEFTDKVSQLKKAA